MCASHREGLMFAGRGKQKITDHSNFRRGIIQYGYGMVSLELLR